MSNNDIYDKYEISTYNKSKPSNFVVTRENRKNSYDSPNTSNQKEVNNDNNRNNQ